MKRILHLTLHREWFDQIAQGVKTFEYREIKPYWTRRLIGREYDLIRFRNGYQKNAPKMDCRFLGVEEGVSESGRRCYAIRLGEVTNVQNWPIE